jgi:hypothetical protein
MLGELPILLTINCVAPSGIAREFAIAVVIAFPIIWSGRLRALVTITHPLPPRGRRVLRTIPLLQLGQISHRRILAFAGFVCLFAVRIGFPNQYGDAWRAGRSLLGRDQERDPLIADGILRVANRILELAGGSLG